MPKFDYFIDTKGGDDAADGRTPETAWLSAKPLEGVLDLKPRPVNSLAECDETPGSIYMQDGKYVVARDGRVALILTV